MECIGKENECLGFHGYPMTDNASYAVRWRHYEKSMEKGLTGMPIGENSTDNTIVISVPVRREGRFVNMRNNELQEPQQQQQEIQEEDPEITVCYRDGRRKKMKTSEAMAMIDNSKLLSPCRKCKHDINDHAAVTNYVDRPAGRCLRAKCGCNQYRPGEMLTKEEAKKRREASRVSSPR